MVGGVTLRANHDAKAILTLLLRHTLIAAHPGIERPANRLGVRSRGGGCGVVRRCVGGRNFRVGGVGDVRGGVDRRDFRLGGVRRGVGSRLRVAIEEGD